MKSLSILAIMAVLALGLSLGSQFKPKYVFCLQAYEIVNVKGEKVNTFLLKQDCDSEEKTGSLIGVEKIR